MSHKKILANCLTTNCFNVSKRYREETFTDQNGLEFIVRGLEASITSSLVGTNGPRIFVFRHGDVRGGTDGDDDMTLVGKEKAGNAGELFWELHKESLKGKKIILCYGDNQRTKITAEKFKEGAVLISKESPDSILDIELKSKCTPFLTGFSKGNTNSDIMKVCVKCLAVKDHNISIEQEQIPLAKVMLGDCETNFEEIGNTLENLMDRIVEGLNETMTLGEDKVFIFFTSRGNISVFSGVQKRGFSTRTWLKNSLGIKPVSYLDLMKENQVS